MPECNLCENEAGDNVVKVTRYDNTPLEVPVCDDCYDFVVEADEALDALARLGFLLLIKRRLEKRLGVKLI